MNVPKTKKHTYITHTPLSSTWTYGDPPLSPQNRDLTIFFTTFHFRCVRLWLEHIGFYLTWEQHRIVLHQYWNTWEVQLRLAPHLEYLPNKSHLWSQYFDSKNLEYTAKSTPTSLWSLDHWRIRVQGLRIQSLLDITSHTIPCLEYIDFPNRFPLAFERTCSRKYIATSNLIP